MTKEQRNEYMKNYRKAECLQKNVNKLLALVIAFCDFCLQKNVKSLHENVNETLKSLHNCVNLLENCLQKNVKSLHENVNDLQKNVNENRENGSKTAFSAISGENSASRGEGGLGGGVLNTSTSNRNCTVTDVTSTIYLKEKNTKKRKENLQKNVNSSQKNVKPYSEDFEKVWSFYPRHEGTSKIKAWEAWQKQAMPELNFLLAVLFFEKDKEQWQDETKIPHLSTWINQRRWEGYTEAKVRASIKYRELCGTKQACTTPAKIDEEKEAREKIAKQNQRLKEIIGNQKIKLPTVKEWRSMPSGERIELAKKYEGYSFDEVSSAVFYKDLDVEEV